MNEKRHIGNYQVISEIGAGSFGRVYLAQHAVLTNRKVAIKLMNVAYLASQEEQEHFLQEARFLEMLKHPYILSVLDVGIHEGLPYLVAEYASGGSLRQRLKQQRVLSEQTALTLLSQIGQALYYAHQQNIIHRDIKPENILFNAEGHALLADFGLATALTTSSIKYVSSAGTPSYMSPEQFRGTISKESDQYALACIAYEIFTGQPIFAVSDPVAMMYKQVHAEPVPPTQHNFMLSPHIERAILRALSKQRQDRYPDVQSFLTALLATPTPQPIVQSFIPAASAVQQSHSYSEIAYLELPEPEQSLSIPDPQTPIPPSLVERIDTNPGSTMVLVEEMTGKAYAYSSVSTNPPQQQPQTTPPLFVQNMTGQPQPFSIEHYNTNPPFNKRTLLVAGAIICLLVMLIGGSVFYAFANSSSKAAGSSSHATTGTSITPDQQTSPQNGSTQSPNPNTGTPNSGTQAHPTNTPSGGSNPNPPPPSGNSSAAIVITPASKDIKNIYTITAVPGTPNSSQHQVAALILTSTQLQSQTVNATGQGSTQATPAQGTITVSNSGPTPFTITAGQTTIQTLNNSTPITVTLTQNATVPAADTTTTPATPGQAQVSASTNETGSIANIPALAINTSDTTNSSVLYVNNAPFTGGQDAQTYAVLQQSDIDNAASPLISSLTPTAQSGVQSQIQRNQQLIQQIQCNSSVAPQNPAGSSVVSTTITVTVTCTGEVYNPQDAQNMALSWLQHDATANPSAIYQLSGQPTTTITQAQLSNPQQGIITITVQAESMGVFQFGSTQKQQLAQSLAGQSEQNAQAILAKQAGVAKAVITLGDGNGQTLPQNPQQITITIGS